MVRLLELKRNWLNSHSFKKNLKPPFGGFFMPELFSAPICHFFN